MSLERFECFVVCMRTCPDTLIGRVVLSPQLVLRKWSELIPGGEFRCFVKENKLIGKMWEEVQTRLW